MSKLKLLPRERTIIPPEVWEKGVYLVEVAMNEHNPIHSAILVVKFLREGPVNEVLWNPTWGTEHRIREAHYLRVVKKVTDLQVLV